MTNRGDPPATTSAAMTWATSARSRKTPASRCAGERIGGGRRRGPGGPRTRFRRSPGAIVSNAQVPPPRAPPVSRDGADQPRAHRMTERRLCRGRGGERLGNGEVADITRDVLESQRSRPIRTLQPGRVLTHGEPQERRGAPGALEQEVGRAGAVQQLLAQVGGLAQVGRDLLDVGQDVAGMHPAGAAGAVVLAEDVVGGRLATGQAQLVRLADEDLLELLGGGIGDVDLVADAAEEGLVHQLRRVEVGGEEDQHPEGHLDLLADHRHVQVVDPLLEGHDEAVQQLPRRDVLAPEVVDQEDAAVGLHLQARLVELEGRLPDQVQHREVELATDLDEWTPAADPALVGLGDGRPHGLVVAGVVEADDGVVASA